MGGKEGLFPAPEGDAFKDGGPLEPLKGPGDLERPPGIILTAPPSPPAAGCGAPLRRFGHRPPLAGRQAGGREPREEPQEKPGGPGKGKQNNGGAV